MPVTRKLIFYIVVGLFYRFLVAFQVVNLSESPMLFVSCTRARFIPLFQQLRILFALLIKYGSGN